MRRVGILGHVFIEWAGGVDLLRLLVSSLQATSAPVEIHLLVPSPSVARRMLRQLRIAVRGSRGRPQRVDILADLGSFATTGLHEIGFGHRALARAASRLRLDVIMPSTQPLPFGSELPWLGYVTDFQHRRLPHLFSAIERNDRDRDFGRLLRVASTVLCNAKAAADDAEAFFSPFPARLFALPFGAAPDPAWFKLDAVATQRRYGIERPYFIVCNQFWKHKDHGTAFRAFAEVVRSQPDLALVCTGATADYRDQDYVPSLMHEAESLQISDKLHVLGLVPKHDQIALLRGSIGLLQPTLFEGGPGGGAVYDSVSLGVPSCVSDIAVNRELDDATVSLFAAGDATALAAAMTATLARITSRASPVSLIAQGRERRARCGAVLLQAIDAAAGRS